jgi:gas vesicle protein
MKFARFFEGIIFGGLLGAGLALVLAPASGEQLRSLLQSEAEHMRLEVERAASDRRA